jgi:alkyl sulfatase BDS1-like metallo-beta-lactamase superfamily hydrolase
MGTTVFDAYNEAEGHPRAQVVGHVDVAPRFARYRRTLGYNSVINQRQFQAPGLQWPSDYRLPDLTYTDRVDLDVGGLGLELHHARGETDDHTWVWVPDRRVLCTGDLFIWAVPNAGNPQKVQRYAADWAVALREMASLGAELLLPGHGLPIAGEARVRAALVDTATFLESLERQTLELMNAGAALDEVLHTVRPPAALADRPYLQPVYDEPEFIVRNIWRLYGGWYDGNPARLKPAPDAAVAAEISGLAGGVQRLAERASELADDGDFRLACHLVELAARAAPDDVEVHRRRADVYARRVEHETSTMAKGVFSWAAAESTRRADS